MRTINATLVGPANRKVESMSPMGLRSAARFQLADGTLSVRDTTMRTVRSATFPAPPESVLLFAREDLTTAVTVDDAGMTIWQSGVPVRVEVAGAGVATLLTPEHLLVVAPVFAVREWLGQDEDDDPFDQWALLLLDAATGAVLDSDAPLLHEGDLSAVPHPHDGSVVLAVDNGQDGSWLYRVRIVEGRVQVEEILRDVVAADFGPSGDRLLVMPYFGAGETEALVLSWPDLDRVASMSTTDPQLAGACFDYYGCFLGEDRLVLKMHDPEQLLVCRADLTDPAWVQAPTGDNPEIEVVVGLSSDTVLVQACQDHDTAASIWHIPA